MTERERIANARALLQTAVADRIFPAAAVEVGSHDGPIWREAFGTLTFDAASKETADDTIFDLASLTKPIATTSIVMHLIATHAISLEAPLAGIFVDWSGTERATATIRDLLEHASGLPARLVDRPPSTRREFEHDICALPLEYVPRTRSLYSDLDFILLGFLAEDRGHAPLATQFADVLDRVASGVVNTDSGSWLGFGAPRDHPRIAATMPQPDDMRRGRMLIGEVHDNYAAALGGVAGHAGLFGTAAGVGAFARIVLRAAVGDRSVASPLSPALVHLATRKSAVPESSRALGWDTMLPTSSCGTQMSPAAFGHVGYTGTSLWIDPVLDRYFVLLTNRVCNGGTSEQMQVVRRGFHDLAATM